jgi:hypothetical protein
MRALAASVSQPTFGWALLIAEAAWSFAQGDLQASEQWAIQEAEAHDTAARLGAEGITREITECRAVLAATGG